ncbi:hypothetical protein E4U23_008632 [Claviceps purpurea]|nr:hypothetical protein E4U10_005032 [Claviceps purpurea]KAG6252591.1 hypothetical protein E4U23_008632 [Claviceps purpurea]
MSAANDIQRILARIKGILPAHRQAPTAQRNIKLGLERISRVVPEEQTWTGIHVGGTNGKGSICALLSAMFKLSGIRHGTYISPALPERHNGIMINGIYVNKRMHELELEHVEMAYKRLASRWSFAHAEDDGDMTPFELETATAFRIFNKMKVQYGIVEVGMGGSSDATNVMKQKAVTVISKIDLDHQEYLGNTIKDIAQIKAGIMQPGVPCVVDYTNPPEVMDVLQEHAQSIGTNISLSSNALPLIQDIDREKFHVPDYEQQNLLCATVAFQHLFPNLKIDTNKLLSLRPRLPGRMEPVYVSELTNGLRKKSILVDGAHNMLGVKALAEFVNGNLRKGNEPVTWVMGLSSSKSKPFAKMIETLVLPQDNLAFVEYAPSSDVPPPAPAELGRSVAAEIITDDSRLYAGSKSIGKGIEWACSIAGEDDPVVLTGSLYMIREFYKMSGVEPTKKIRSRRPGRSQLWYYTQLAEKRSLTMEEAREFKQARRHWRLYPENSPIFRGDTPTSPVTPENIRKLQSSAALHRTQMEGYEQAIRSIKADLQGADDAALCKSLQDLEAKRQEHLNEYNAAMLQVRGHVLDSGQKPLTYKSIFGKPEKAKRKVTTIMVREGIHGIVGEAAREDTTSSTEETRPDKEQLPVKEETMRFIKDGMPARKEPKADTKDKKPFRDAKFGGAKRIRGNMKSLREDRDTTMPLREGDKQDRRMEVSPPDSGALGAKENVRKKRERRSPSRKSLEKADGDEAWLRSGLPKK